MKRTFTLLLLLYSLNLNAQPCTPNTHSILFNGFSDYVAMPANASLNITSHLSVEAWINSNSWGFTSAENSIICKHGWSSGEGGFVIRAGAAGELSFNIAGLDTNGNPTSWVEVISAPNALTLNTWIHVAGTYDGDSLNLYINGQLIGSTLFQGTIVNSPTYDLKIGRLADNQPGIYRYFDGYIDEARVWDRALTQAEIASNMNTQIDPAIQTGLVGYWRLNDGSGTLVSDLSVNAINATLTGTGWSTNVPFTTGAPPALITPSGNTTFCQGDTITLSANSGIGLFYLWSNGSTTQDIQVNTSGTYTVTVSDANNCSAVSNPVTVTVNPSPAVPVITFNGSQLLCSALSGIQWYLNGNTLFNEVFPTYTPTQNGSYTVIVTDNNGCTASSSPFVLNNLGIEQTLAFTHFALTSGQGSSTLLLTIGIRKPTLLHTAIFDMLGKKIGAETKYELQSGIQTIYLPVTALQPGTYCLHLQSGEAAMNKVITIIR